ncbi:hypothetical protein AX14_006133 [Amanita brunnescens Koide BX004]|nr:hypothetical protein AX14_006133 [Amanita brunnescens Koide BX004]
MSIIPPPTDVALMPSDVVPVTPTKVDEAPQQASTAPGDGHVVHDNPHEKEESTDQSPTQTSHNKVPFREQVIGYAQKTRGTILQKVYFVLCRHNS